MMMIIIVIIALSQHLVPLRLLREAMSHCSLARSARLARSQQVLSLFPASGPAAGQNVVRVTGLNFINTNLLTPNSLKCTFNSTVVDAVFVSATELQAPLPTSAPGLGPRPHSHRHWATIAHISTGTFCSAPRDRSTCAPPQAPSSTSRSR